MNKSRFLAFFSAIAVLVGCSGGSDKSFSVPEQLKLVPSDALYVHTGGNCAGCLSLLDSTHIFRKLSLGASGDSPATLAYCYTNTLSPVLIVGTEGLEPSTAEHILDQAGHAGIRAELIRTQGSYISTHNLVFTTSETVMATVLRHIGAHTSILDAPGFAASLIMTGGCDEWTMLHNTDAGKFFGKDFLSDFFPPKSATSLLRHYADWTCFSEAVPGMTDIRTSQTESDIYFSNVFNRLDPLYSRLPRVLPQSTAFALTVPVNTSSFRESYEKYLDATLTLEKYRARLDALKKQYGKNPLDWEKELDIQEVSLVQWDSSTVALVRAARTFPAREIGTNDNPGFIPALFGSAFSIQDDSFCAYRDGWFVVGSETDVAKFLGAVRFEDFNWPARLLKFMIYTPGAMLYQGKDCIKLETYDSQSDIRFSK